jgi:hypothetical protein
MYYSDIYLYLILGVGFLCYLVFGSLGEEAFALYGKWRTQRGPFTDRKQSVPVRACAQRLNSKKSQVRLDATQTLGELNDVTAVPALVHALEVYERDAAFLEVAVSTLGRLGDARALPALHRLTGGRNASLMQAARRAIEAIEPKTALLRASSAPASNRDVLLRPAGSGPLPAARNMLIRASRAPTPSSDTTDN